MCIHNSISNFHYSLAILIRILTVLHLHPVFIDEAHLVVRCEKFYLQVIIFFFNLNFCVKIFVSNFLCQIFPVPDMETQMNLSAKMIDRRTCTPKGNHSYGPFFLEYSLLAEYNLLQKQKLPGVYVIPSSETSLCK